MQKIIGIYNANGSLLGEMRYVFDKVFLKKHCALCDITHGMSYKAKRTWLEQAERFQIPIETLHLDEISNDIRQVVADKVPCVVIVDRDSINIVMSSEELQACDSNQEQFFERLRVNVNV
ncbi:hypothetical protein [uncultured Psychrobacter sp.]|uniref:hypothetical protein n=1 Tax=uncultured Psychrobacter sp. TaxID=259303 RepID=UPI002592617B|nr:hypothetical protein [uncultured Psychrobacter sp.]